MKQRDMRPPFAALGGTIPPELFDKLPTPCYLLDEDAADAATPEILGGLAQRTGCKVLLAQKAFCNYRLLPPAGASTWPVPKPAACLKPAWARKRCPARKSMCSARPTGRTKFDELLQYADHIVFNSPAQLAKFGPAAKAAGKSVGLRINPECSTQDGHAIYDPCAPGSRLGTTRAQWNAAVAAKPALPNLLDGLHFHTLCEQDSDALATTLDAVAQEIR